MRLDQGGEAGAVRRPACLGSGRVHVEAPHLSRVRIDDHQLEIVGGAAAATMADGPQAVRLKIFFDDPDRNAWKLGWTAGPFRARGADWGEVTCVQSSDPNDDTAPCIAWRVRPTINGSPGTEDDFAGMQSMGSQPDGGLRLVPTEIAVCVKGEVSPSDCAAIVR